MSKEMPKLMLWQ